MFIRSATNVDAPAIRELVFGVLGEYGLLAEHQGVDADLADIQANYISRGGLFDLVFEESRHSERSEESLPNPPSRGPQYARPLHCDGGYELDSGPGLIGTIGLYPRASSVAELRKMYLLKSARGRGIGKKMLEHVLARTRTLGFHRIELETSSKLVEAIGLYKKYGFAALKPEHLACRCDQAYALDLD
jgi:putative acetyltransferase